MDGFYGYPYCWAVDVLVNHSRGEIFAWGGDGKDFYRDGTHDDQWCKQYTLPATYAMQAHTAPLGVAFYDGKGKVRPTAHTEGRRMSPSALSSAGQQLTRRRLCAHCTALRCCGVVRLPS